MLPRLEMSRDDCRKCLRCLELDAYANMVSVLRAQGPFTVDKKKLLQELASVLHISNERHRAEIRRAVNDDKLTAIAEQLNGPNTGTDWAIEGRRTISLLPRLKAHNAFTTLANSLSIVTAIANEKESRTTKKSVEDTETQPAVKPDCTNVKFMETRKRKRTFTESFNNDEKTQKQASHKITVSNTETPIQPSPTPNKVLVLPSPVVEVSNSTKNIVQTVIPVTMSNTTASAQNVSQAVARNNSKVQIHRSKANSTVPISLPKSEHKLVTIRTKPAQNVPSNNGIETEVKDININADKAIKLISISNNVQKISKSDLNSNMHRAKPTPVMTTEIMTSTTEKCVPQTNIAHTITTNSSCFTSCGPGPPTTEAAKITPTFIRNKFPSFKLNKFPTKMAGAKLAKKGNFIVLQKAPLREITLSHGGKEVLGKFIVGGKNLRLANQQNVNAITLVPHRTTQITNCNGEQNATNSLMTTTAVHTKANNVISNVTSELKKTINHLDQGPTNFDVNFEAALVDQTEDFSSHDKSNDSTNSISSIENSQDELCLNQDENREEDEPRIISSELNYENNVICNDDENENSTTIIEEFLDPEADNYDIQSTTESANNTEVEDYSSAELFESDLNSSKFNIEHCTLMETEDSSTILDATENTMLIIDEIDEVCDS